VSACWPQTSSQSICTATQHRWQGAASHRWLRSALQFALQPQHRSLPTSNCPLSCCRCRLHLVRTCANPGGAKPVLLLLHGFPEGWFTWRRQMEALAKEGWCVIAVDMRGYGDSDKPQVRPRSDPPAVVVAGFGTLSGALAGQGVTSPVLWVRSGQGAVLAALPRVTQMGTRLGIGPLCNVKDQWKAKPCNTPGAKSSEAGR
jgi:pimeloyl-ACP methyl ester carboxylesterase